MEFNLKTEIDVALTHLFGALSDNRFDGEDYLKITEAIERMLKIRGKYVTESGDASDDACVPEGEVSQNNTPTFVEDVVAKVHKDKTITLEPVCKKQMLEMMYLAAFLTKQEWEKVNEAVRVTHIQQGENPPESIEYVTETYNRIKSNFLRMFQNEK